MIDDIVALKRAMQEMDAEDPEVAQAAKERAAQTLSDARMNFSKLAELIEQRRLLLRPRIVTGLKRMDQPGMLGEAAFRDAGSALRREGQSFGQIAEALELSGSPAEVIGSPAPRYETLTQMREPLRRVAGEPLVMGSEPLEMASDPPVVERVDPGVPGWRLRAFFFVARVLLFPLRHPILFLAMVLLAWLLYHTFPSAAPVGRLASGYYNVVSTIRSGVDNVTSSLSSLFDQLFRSKEPTTPPTPPLPIPSPSTAAPSPSPVPPAAPSTKSASPAASPTPSPSASPSPAPSKAVPPPSSAAPAAPPVSTPHRQAKGGTQARPPANCCVAWEEERPPPPARRTPYEEDRPFSFDDIIPEAIRRNSRVAGPCVGGIGGCAWGGGRY
jgi:hypothetical protein